MPQKIYKDAEAPIYEIMIGEEDETGIRLVSLVDEPAIEIQGMFFNKDEVMSYEFKNIKEKQMVVGPALIPNKKIPRKDNDGEIYFVYFSEDTIRTMVSKFNKFNNNKSINVDHSNQMIDGYIQQNWIVEDAYYDKSRMYGYTLPKGSWFIEVKIENKDQWMTYVKEGGRYSFSVEGLMGQRPSNMNYSQIIDSLTEDELVEIADSIISTEKFNKVKHLGRDKETYQFAKAEELYEYRERLGVPPVITETRTFCQDILDAKRYYTKQDIDDMTSILGYDVFSFGGHWYHNPLTGNTTEECRHEWVKVPLSRWPVLKIPVTD